MRREATWINMGTDVRGISSIDEVLAASKLNYTVEKRPIMVGNEGYVIPNKFATTIETPEGDVDRTFGVVGGNYTICQNSDAFDFVNYINEDLEFIKAGETRGGLIYIIAKLPEQHVLGDNMTPYVIFQNGHNGNIPIRAAITPLRMVCQNQFNMAFKKSDNTINIRHASTLEMRMDIAKEVLKKTANYMDTFRLEAEELATIRVAGKEHKIVEHLFPTSEERSDSFNERQLERQYKLLNDYDADDNQNFKGTAWGMVNAYSDYITHQLPARDTENWQESRFTKVTFDPKIMQRFVKQVKSFA